MGINNGRDNNRYLIHARGLWDNGKEETRIIEMIRCAEGGIRSKEVR